jgi:hypothetical protein
LIKSYIEAGYAHLFSSQVINFSTTYRKSAYGMIAAAIDEAVEQTRTLLLTTTKAAVPTTQRKARRSAEKTGKQADVVHESNTDVQIIDEQLRQLIKVKYGSAEEFFADATKKEGISRKEWKAALQRLGMALGDGERLHFTKNTSF